MVVKDRMARGPLVVALRTLAKEAIRMMRFQPGSAASTDGRPSITAGVTNGAYKRTRRNHVATIYIRVYAPAPGARLG